ncbi:MAG: hypothetical protein AB7V26_15265, partial [Lysobacterales bacterium]
MHRLSVPPNNTDALCCLPQPMERLANPTRGKEMKRLMRWMLAAVLFSGVQGVALASFAPALPDYLWPITPTTGMYFDETQAGTGLGVDLIPVNGQTFFFGAFYHYDPNGAPTWFTFQSFLEQRSMAAYRQDGIPAAVSGPWIASSGGQCFDCAYSAPNTVATPFARTINVVGARHLRMPASGNAPDLNLQRTDAVVVSGHLLGQAVLDSGTVFKVTARYRSLISNGPPQLFNNGWVRFRLRPASEVHNLFTGFTAEPGATPNLVPPPQWMVLAGDPNTLPQHEAECVHEVNIQGGPIGLCDALFGMTARPFDDRNNTWTFFRDPISDRLRAYRRCIGLQTICNVGRATHINGVADVIEATPTRPGLPPRLIARVLDLEGGVLNQKLEFSPVSPEELAA